MAVRALRAGPGRAARPRTGTAGAVLRSGVTVLRPGVPVGSVRAVRGPLILVLVLVLAGYGPGGQAAVAFLEQVQIGADAQFAQRAGDPGGAQLAGPLLDMLPGRQDLIRRQFPGGHPGVPGFLPERADVRVRLAARSSA